MNSIQRYGLLAGGFLVGAVLSGYVVKRHYCVDGVPEQVQWSRVVHVQNALDKPNIVDVAVIGSGPAGLSAALYASRFARKTVVIEGKNRGGQLMETSYVENWPGFEKILGPEVMEKLHEQAARFHPLFLADTVESVDFGSWPLVIKTNDGLTIHALSVIIATGSSPKKLGAPGEQEYWGRGVTTCAICDAPFYKDEEVVVVGGGDSAVEEAIQLAPYAKKITLLVRGTTMRASQVMQSRLAGYPNIVVRYNTSIKQILGDGVHVTGVDIVDTKTQETSHMRVSGVFLAIGHTPNSALFARDLQVDDVGYIKNVGRSQATSVPGVFAAGDVEDNVYRQAGVAAGNGIKAGIDADRFLTALGIDTRMEETLSKNYLTIAQKTGKELPKLETLAAYEAALGDGSVPVILDFYTDTCPSCLQMLPILGVVAQEYDGKAKIFKVDAEVADELVKKFLVYRVPCIIVIKNKELAARYNEALGKKELVDLIEQVL